MRSTYELQNTDFVASGTDRENTGGSDKDVLQSQWSSVGKLIADIQILLDDGNRIIVPNARNNPVIF